MEDFEQILSDPAVMLASANYTHQAGLAKALSSVCDKPWFNPSLFSDRLGISEAELAAYIDGTNDMTLTELRMLATTLGIEVNYVVTFFPEAAEYGFEG